MIDSIKVYKDATAKSGQPVYTPPGARRIGERFYPWIKQNVGASMTELTLDSKPKSVTGKWEDEDLPEFMSEEELDEFLVRSGVIDKLLSRLDATPPSTNWEAELDDL